MQDSSAFQFLAIDTIHESTTNPRRTFDEAKLYELAESIKHNGLIQPITVRPNSQGFEIVAGARRYRAAQLAWTSGSLHAGTIIHGLLASSFAHSSPVRQSFCNHRK
jgi:ParB-like nuclease domain